MAVVRAVARDETHRFSKTPVAEIRLLAGLGVEGDAHLGERVQHRSRVAVDPTQPNLRQVHLLSLELLEELAAAGFEVAPAALGENVLASGIDLLAQPLDTRLRLGGEAVVRVTGLRNPCAQIERFRPGLLARLVGRDEEGRPLLRAGIMAVVEAGGTVRPGDTIGIERPAPPHRRLERV
jgi:MOSC domain-containing protein YiiM